MDTSDYPSLPKIRQLHARLAANSRHIDAVIDSQIDVIERLFSATTAGDWPAVAAASRYLAALQPDQIGPDVVREARQVMEELNHAPAGLKQPRHFDTLLAACREARKS